MIVRSLIDAYMVNYVLKIRRKPYQMFIRYTYLPIEDLDQRELKAFS